MDVGQRSFAAYASIHTKYEMVLFYVDVIISRSFIIAFIIVLNRFNIHVNDCIQYSIYMADKGSKKPSKLVQTENGPLGMDGTLRFSS